MIGLDGLAYIDKEINPVIVVGLVDFIDKKYLVLNTPPLNGEFGSYFSETYNNIDSIMRACELSVLSQEEIIRRDDNSSIVWGTRSNELDLGDIVFYNFKKYTVIGRVLNTYAQLNIQTPVLFSMDRMFEEYKNLLYSKYSDDEILNIINDKLKGGQYKDDFALPFTNAEDENSWGEKIKLVKNYNREAYSKIIQNLNDRYFEFEEKSQTKDFLKDFLLTRQDEKLEILADRKPEFYESFVRLINVVNNKIYSQEKGMAQVEPEILDFEKMMEEELDFESLMEEQLGE